MGQVSDPIQIELYTRSSRFQKSISRHRLGNSRRPSWVLFLEREANPGSQTPTEWWPAGRPLGWKSHLSLACGNQGQGQVSDRKSYASSLTKGWQPGRAAAETAGTGVPEARMTGTRGPTAAHQQHPSRATRHPANLGSQRRTEMNFSAKWGTDAHRKSHVQW